MPLPDNPAVNKTATRLVNTIHAAFNTPKNYGPVHAKGQLAKLIVPVQGVMKYSMADAEAQGKSYLFDDLEFRLTHEKPIKYRFMAQLAEEGDEINDSAKMANRFWTMDEGAESGRDQKRINYDPAPGYIDGIGVNDDPLVEMRTAVYLMSGKI
ncbi:hypothetical protein BDZ45DRAFT_732090 [Acephala macrosclerotiorum]|nr:hypothetical protein BDZ45DRAFT_732090 [Acephala macrosclerotiorum]